MAGPEPTAASAREPQEMEARSVFIYTVLIGHKVEVTVSAAGGEQGHAAQSSSKRVRARPHQYPCASTGPPHAARTHARAPSRMCAPPSPSPPPPSPTPAQMLSGKAYEGVFHMARASGAELLLVLKQARELQRRLDKNSLAEKPAKNLILKFAEVAQLTAQDVNFSAQEAGSGSGGGAGDDLRTDEAIGRGKGRWAEEVNEGGMMRGVGGRARACMREGGGGVRWGRAWSSTEGGRGWRAFRSRCMHACMHACTHALAHARVCTRPHACTYVCIRPHACTYVCTRTHTCTNTRTRPPPHTPRALPPRARSGFGRDLTPWMPELSEEGGGAGLLALDDGGADWDQFAANRDKFGYQSTYNENLYTTELNKQSCNISEQEAARIAREIETQAPGTSNYHMLEERGGELDDGDEVGGCGRAGLGCVRCARQGVPPITNLTKSPPPSRTRMCACTRNARAPPHHTTPPRLPSLPL